MCRGGGNAGAKLTAAADIYALGMIAYTLLVGEAYWAAETKLAAGELVAFALIAARGPVEPPVRRAGARGVALPAGFDAWFARATAVDPAQRFARASEAANALAQVFGLAPLRTGPMPSHAEISAVTRAPSRPGSGPVLLTPAGASMTSGSAVMTPAAAPRSAGRIVGLTTLVIVLAAVVAGLLGTIAGLYLMRSKGAASVAPAVADTAAPAVTEAAAATAAPAPTPAVSALTAPAALSSAMPSGSTVSPEVPASNAKPATAASVRAPAPIMTASPTTKRKRPEPD